VGILFEGVVNAHKLFIDGSLWTVAFFLKKKKKKKKKKILYERIMGVCGAI